MSIRKAKFEPGRGYTEADWNEADVAPLTDAELASARPFAEAFPDLAAKMERIRGGRPRAETPKQVISIRLDAEVIDKFKATGAGWQTRMNAALKAAKI